MLLINHDAAAFFEEVDAQEGLEDLELGAGVRIVRHLVSSWSRCIWSGLVVELMAILGGLRALAKAFLDVAVVHDEKVKLLRREDPGGTYSHVLLCLTADLHDGNTSHIDLVNERNSAKPQSINQQSDDSWIPLRAIWENYNAHPH